MFLYELIGYRYSIYFTFCANFHFFPDFAEFYDRVCGMAQQGIDPAMPNIPGRLTNMIIDPYFAFLSGKLLLFKLATAQNVKRNFVSSQAFFISFRIDQRR
jgi:hypothetical protein